MLFVSFLFTAFWASAFAQDFSIPGSWREFGSNRSKDERVKMAKAALDSVVSKIDPATAFGKDIGYWGTAATDLSAMANFDHFTGGSNYKDLVTKTLNTASTKYTHFDQFGFNDDAMWWATASYYAYRAYGDITLLNHAIDTWERVSTYQISSSGKVSGSKSVPISAQCDGVSMSGGVFWKPDPKDKNINSITTGLFMTLSAYLASTSNGAAQYKNAAIASANWLKNANKDAKSNLLLDTLSSDCSRSPANWVFTYNTGKYLEGLNVLAKVTGDNSWKTEMTNVAVAAMKTGPWQGANGVITEGKNDDKQDDADYFKAVYVRALNELFMSGSDQSAFAILLHSYIDVQYNAVLELAAKGSSYSSGWAGPGHDFTAWSQSAALDALVSAITANT